MEGLVTRHEVWTWELLHILFSHIDAPPAEAEGDNAVADMDTGGGSEPAAAARKRRALLSCWLRVRAAAPCFTVARSVTAVWS